MLLGLFAGCGGKSAASDTSASQKESVSTTTDSAPESTPAQVSDEPASDIEASVSEPSMEEPEVDRTITLPLTQDDVSFTMWHDFVPPLADYMDGMQDKSAPGYTWKLPALQRTPLQPPCRWSLLPATIPT